MMLVTMAIAIAAVDLATSSEVHSFLFARLDAQISSAQGQIVGYIDRMYNVEVRSGNKVAKTDPAAWLDGLDAAPLVHRPHLPDEPPSLAGRPSILDLENHIPPDEYVELIDANGTLLLEHAIGPIDDPAP